MEDYKTQANIITEILKVVIEAYDRVHGDGSAVRELFIERMEER